MLLKDKVAVITGGAGLNGLGFATARQMAAQGARVVIMDLERADPAGAAARLGEGHLGLVGDVTDKAACEAAAAAVMKAFGRIDILVNNAGILRDKTFAKMDIADFRAVLDVHLMGAVHLCKAAWPHMVAQKYGRIVLTTSSSGLYGNFGQSNYGAAKLALVGLMQTLALEGAKSDIRVNCLAPTATTRMTEHLFPADMLQAFGPEAVVPAMLVMASQDAPTRTTLCAGAGAFESAHITLTRGAYVGIGPDADSHLAERLAEVTDRAGETVPGSGNGQGENELRLARAAQGAR